MKQIRMFCSYEQAAYLKTIHSMMEGFHKANNNIVTRALMRLFSQLTDNELIDFRLIKGYVEAIRYELEGA